MSVVGIVLGALGINSKGKGMAIAGIILSAVGLVLAIILRVIFRGVLFSHIWQQFLTNHGY
jgi:flagellar biosynthesis component FlhA